MKHQGSITLLLVILFLFSCEEFIEIDAPRTEIGSSSVFSNDGTAIAAMRGIYSQMISGDNSFSSGGLGSVTFLGALISDEFTCYSTVESHLEFFENALTAENQTLRIGLWQEPYRFINNVNTLIEGLEHSDDVTDSLKIQLTGEAKFVRAFCYFYLTNLFGDVPLVTSSDYRKNVSAARHSSEEVYAQMINDLSEAVKLLSQDYSWSGGMRNQPTKWAAVALLSRISLYVGDWSKAKELAALLIDEKSLFELPEDLNAVFLTNSGEAIWQLTNGDPNVSTFEARNFILTSDPKIAALAPELTNAFEAGDNRLLNWVGSYDNGDQVFYFPFKYKEATAGSGAESSMVLRLAEQYLIRAEACARSGDLAGARADINAIRLRAGLPPTNSESQAELLEIIFQERRVELFSEWGHRWLDLKRVGKADEVLKVLKTDWQSTDRLLPIPISEIENGQNIVQNPGY